jgi:hypothetical protein
VKKILRLILSENGCGVILLIWFFGVPAILFPWYLDVFAFDNIFLQIITAGVFIWFYFYGYFRLDKFLTAYKSKLDKDFWDDLEKNRDTGRIYEESRVSKIMSRFDKHNLTRVFDKLTNDHPRVYKFVRWILFIPVGLLAGSIAWLVTYFMSEAMNQSEAIGTYIFAIWGGGLSGGISCWIVCFVVPNHKARVGLISAVIMAVYLLTGTFYMLDDDLIHHFSAISYLLGYGYVGIQLFRKKMYAGYEV